MKATAEVKEVEYTLVLNGEEARKLRALTGILAVSDINTAMNRSAHAQEFTAEELWEMACEAFYAVDSAR